MDDSRLATTGGSSRDGSKNNRCVLDEEQYVDALTAIIERDYFPLFKRRKLQLDRLLDVESSLGRTNSDIVDTTVEKKMGNLDELSLTEFFQEFTSDDNASYEKLQEEALQEFRKRYHWMYEDREDPQRKPGMLMLYYLNNGTAAPQVLSAADRERMDKILLDSSNKYAGLSQQSISKLNGVGPSKFRVRNQLMFPPELKDSRDTCRIPEQKLLSNGNIHLASPQSIKSAAGNEEDMTSSVLLLDSNAKDGAGNQCIHGSDDPKLRSALPVCSRDDTARESVLLYNERVMIPTKESNNHPFASNGSVSIAGALETRDGSTRNRQKIIQRQNTNFADREFTAAVRRWQWIESPLEAPHTPSVLGSDSGAPDDSSSVDSGAQSAGTRTAPSSSADCHHRLVSMSPLCNGTRSIETNFLCASLFTWGSLIAEPMEISSEHLTSLDAAAQIERHQQQVQQQRAFEEEERAVPQFVMQPVNRRELLARQKAPLTLVSTSINTAASASSAATRRSPAADLGDTSKSLSSLGGVLQRNRSSQPFKSLARRTAHLTPAAQSLLAKQKQLHGR